MDSNIALMIAIVALCSVLVWWMITQFIDEDRNESFRMLANRIDNNLTENHRMLMQLIENQNVTVELTHNDTNELEQTGSISGLGKPKIVPHD